MVTARVLHAVVAAVALGALVAQAVLVVTGASVLVPEADPGLAVRLVRFVSYFTVQSNLLVLIVSAQLAVDPRRDGRRWRVLRLCSLTAITVTAVVHWVALRPLLDLDGAQFWVDRLLHVVVPLLAVTAWVVAGPRPRITWRVVWWSLVFPVGWLAYTLTVGAATGWYPYPFIDVGARGAGPVAVAALAVTAVLLATSAAFRLLDARVPGRP